MAHVVLQQEHNLPQPLKPNEATGTASTLSTHTAETQTNEQEILVSCSNTNLRKAKKQGKLCQSHLNAHLRNIAKNLEALWPPKCEKDFCQISAKFSKQSWHKSTIEMLRGKFFGSIQLCNDFVNCDVLYAVLFNFSVLYWYVCLHTNDIG